MWKLKNAASSKILQIWTHEFGGFEKIQFENFDFLAENGKNCKKMGESDFFHCLK